MIWSAPAAAAALSFAALVLRALYVVIYWPLKLRAIMRAQGVPACDFVPVGGTFPLLMRYRREDTPFKIQEDFGAKYGRLHMIELGWLPRLVAADPETVADVLTRKGTKFGKPQMIRDFIGPVTGNGLVVLNGAEWKAQRQAINPAFHFANLKAMVPLMVSNAERVLAQEWPEELIRRPGGLEVDIPSAMASATLAVIGAAAFGQSFVEDAGRRKALKGAFEVAMREQVSRGIGLIGLIPVIKSLPTPGKRLVDRAVAQLRSLGAEVVRERRAGKTRSNIVRAPGAPSSSSSPATETQAENADLLDLLLAAPMSEAQLLDELSTFVFAGHETTSTLLSWTLLELMRAPHYWARAAAEVDARLGTGASRRPPVMEDARSLPFVQALLNEALRLYPPAFEVAREALEDVELARSGDKPPLRVPRGTSVSVAIRNLHRDPELWGDRAGEFLPERWLDEAACRARHPFAFVPFVAGPRSCVGKNFAELEAAAMLARLLQLYTFELVPGQKFVDLPVITTQLKYGLRAVVRARAD